MTQFPSYVLSIFLDLLVECLLEYRAEEKLILVLIDQLVVREPSSQEHRVVFGPGVAVGSRGLQGAFIEDFTTDEFIAAFDSVGQFAPKR